ncbi:hypothetical protein CEXT_129171 [Caerostris extrusa]|uniref:Uncharacterized protein n=1 Tax=Caerostris extrusa TaxID=172846 RepID=A0AAV4XVU4_CAEEX|nr:hypothetical protein CEXT_129171 [Caerostris extrusa]
MTQFCFDNLGIVKEAQKVKKCTINKLVNPGLLSCHLAYFPRQARLRTKNIRRKSRQTGFRVLSLPVGKWKDFQTDAEQRKVIPRSF